MADTADKATVEATPPQQNGAGAEDGADVPKEEESRTVATFTKAVGIIEPPPDLRAIVDRTAEFVRKNGPGFEKEILARQGRSVKFHFLRPDNPYNAYYKMKVKGEEIKKVVDMAEAIRIKREEERKRKEEEKAKAEAERLAKAKEDVPLEERIKQLHVRTQRDKGIQAKAPPNDQYTVRHPTTFSACDVDIVKQTALFVARNGRQFLTMLQAKEQHNAQFDFLKPTHPLFTFFQQLVAAYHQIIVTPTQLLESVKQDIANPQRVLDRVVARRKHEEVQLEQAREQAAEDEEERVAMALIDWHDFAIVEVIDFNPQEDKYLPAPCRSVEEMNTILTQQAVAAENSKHAAAMEDDDMDMDMDDDMDVDEPAPANAEDEITAEIKRRYELSRAKEQRESSTRFQKCEICGEMIAIEDISEHMRIELLDPRWKQKKQEILDRQRESSLTENVSISANLSRLARKRADVFIDPEEEKTKEQRDAEEAEAAHNEWAALNSAAAAEASKSAAQQAREQLQQLHQQKQEQQRQAAARAAAAAQAAATQAANRMTQPPPANKPLLPNPGMAMGMGGRPPFPPPGGPSPYGRPPQQFPPSMGGAMPGQFPPQGYPPQPPMGGPPNPMGQMPVVPTPPTGLPHHPAPPPGPPPSKRAKTAPEPAGPTLVPEEEFLAAQEQKTIKVQVLVPKDPKRAPWKFEGQVLDFECELTDSVGSIKKKIQEQVSIPARKQKVRVAGGVFLNKDKNTLAFHNLAPPELKLELGVKERGRKKK